MPFKITTKILLALTGMEIFILFGGWTPIARTQNSPPSSSISRKSSEQAAVLVKQGKAKFKQEDYQGAIADISKAIQLNPEAADSYYQRGLVLGRLGDKTGAIRDFDQAILKNPNYAQAYLQRAGMSFDLGLDFRVTDDRGIDFRTIDYGTSNSGAMLDLRTARDLFAQQGDREGYQTANSLIEHFTRRFKQ